MKKIKGFQRANETCHYIYEYYYSLSILLASKPVSWKSSCVMILSKLWFFKLDSLAFTIQYKRIMTPHVQWLFVSIWDRTTTFLDLFWSTVSGQPSSQPPRSQWPTSLHPSIRLDEPPWRHEGMLEQECLYSMCSHHYIVHHH